jgi:hypothetical protein
MYDWHTSYFIGGGLGLLLLVARISVFESGMFLKTKEKQVVRGKFFSTFHEAKPVLEIYGGAFL